MATLRSPFRYDFVGSFLRPQAIKTARAEFKAGWWGRLIVDRLLKRE